MSYLYETKIVEKYIGEETKYVNVISSSVKNVVPNIF